MESRSRPGPYPIPGWELRAKRLLRTEMARKGATYKTLARELEKLGVFESPAQLNRKVTRGKFSAGFLLACLAALGVREFPVPVDEMAEPPGPRR